MRRRCGMDRKASRIANVGHVVVQLQGIDELPSRFLSTGQLEADEPAILAPQIAVCPFAMNALLLRRVNNALHLLAGAQELHDRLRVFAVLSHAQGKSLEALYCEEGIER